MRITKALGAATILLATALVGGTLIGSALAAPNDTDTTDGPAAGLRAEYCEVFLDTFTSELGTTREELLAAGKAAALAALDAAVADVALDEERATELRERIEGVEAADCSLLGGWQRGFGHGFGHGLVRGFGGADAIEAAATALGLDDAELIGRMRDGESLEEVATAEGVAYEDVTAAVLTELQADLDAAVAEGLAQERADRIIANLTEWLEEGGQPRSFGGRGRGG